MPRAVRELNSRVLPAWLGTATAVIATAISTRTRLWTRLIDGQITTTKVVVIQSPDRGLGLRIRRHFDEREPSRAAGGHVPHEIHAFDRSDAGE